MVFLCTAAPGGARVAVPRPAQWRSAPPRPRATLLFIPFLPPFFLITPYFYGGAAHLLSATCERYRDRRDTLVQKTKHSCESAKWARRLCIFVRLAGRTRHLRHVSETSATLGGRRRHTHTHTHQLNASISCFLQPSRDESQSRRRTERFSFGQRHDALGGMEQLAAAAAEGGGGLARARFELRASPLVALELRASPLVAGEEYTAVVLR